LGVLLALVLFCCLRVPIIWAFMLLVELNVQVVL
jgi:hypothetical protein